MIVRSLDSLAVCSTMPRVDLDRQIGLRMHLLGRPDMVRHVVLIDTLRWELRVIAQMCAARARWMEG